MIELFLLLSSAAGRKGKTNNGKDPESAGPSSPRGSPASNTSGATGAGIDNLDATVEEIHWSKDEKYDAENLLDINYKKHLTRHANK